MASLSLSFLGPPDIRLDGRLLTFGTRKATALLAYLSVTAAAHPRDALAALFWPEADGTKARTSLRQVLWSFNQAGLSEWIGTAEETVGLRSGYMLDTLEFQALAAQVREHHHPEGIACPACVAWLSKAAQLYRGDFLSGFSLKDSPEFDDWQLFQNESLRQMLAHVLEQLIGLLVAGGDLEQAVPHTRRWVAIDPLYEPAQRALMQLYAKSGQRVLALKQYESLCQILDRELGLEPEEESRRIYQDIATNRYWSSDKLSVGHPPSHPSTTQNHPPAAPTMAEKIETHFMQRLHLFFCYARHLEPDESLALQIAQELSWQHEVFFDQATYVNLEWGRRVQDELNWSDFVIVFLSDTATRNEVVLFEIEKACDLNHRQNGRPALLPVRLAMDGPLPEPLGTYLEPFNFALWQNAEDTLRLISMLNTAISEGSLPNDCSKQTKHDPEIRETSRSVLPPAPQTSLLESPEGTLDLGSPFYVEREGDRMGLDALTSQGVTITIKGPRQVGKSSLLIRLKAAAEKQGKQGLFVDFQLLNPALSDADTFYRQFCSVLSYRLGIENRVDEFWSIPLPSPFRCTEYISRHLLQSCDRPIFLALDEVDSIFDTDFRSDFFGMLRTWHNSRAYEPVWKRLDLALVTSTEPYYFIENLNQSPFNVGMTVELQPFCEEQVADLNHRHGSPLNPDQVTRLTALVNGQPYLVRRALYLVARQQISVDDLFIKASDDQGPFGDHLRSLLIRLHYRPALVQGLQQVMKEGSCSDELVFFRLRGTGIIRREQSRVVLSSPLYAAFFGRFFA